MYGLSSKTAEHKYFRAFKLRAFGSLAGLVLGILARRALAFIVYQATSRDPCYWLVLF
jgi:hypothetical protein